MTHERADEGLRRKQINSIFVPVKVRSSLQRRQLGVLNGLSRSILSEGIMHSYAKHQFIKSLLGIAHVCAVLVWLEGCQGCHQVSMSPIPGEQSQIPDPGGIPNLGNTCYMNAVLQIVAKLYPHVFDEGTDPLAEAGKSIVAKIKDDRGFVTREEAEVFYRALLSEAGESAKNRQEDADEYFTILLPTSSTPSCSAWTRMISFNREKNIYNYGAWRSEHYPTTLKIYLPDSNRGHVTMQACFEYSFRDVDLTGQDQYADDYLGLVNAIRQTRLAIEDNSSAPLAVHLMRFTDTGNKNTKKVTGTLELTVPSGVRYEEGASDLHCRLQGFVVHSSGGDTIHSGHYVAYVNQSGQWKQYNDACVHKVTQKDAEEAAQQAYLYFYRLPAS
jgi:Ubiquitin carboxyl-terminal hydrolase